LAAALLAASPAYAAGDARLDALERQLGEVQRQLAEIKDGREANSAALNQIRKDMADSHAALAKRIAGQPRVRLDNGRFSVTSADGDFSLALRGIAQLDAGYFAQGKNPPGVDLNSGTNFRRAQFGFAGTAWRDWSYTFTYEFGGVNAPRNGYIYRAMIQYDGFKPFGIRIGAFAPPSGIEDGNGGSNLIFLERASAANISRGIAGAGGREGVNVFAQGRRYLLSLAYTGGRTTDTATFDEQQALVGRAAWLVQDGDSFKWLVDAHATHVFKVADASPTTSANISLGAGPELAVDPTRTVDTGPLDAHKLTEFGFETAAMIDRFYGQGGWFHYDVSRRSGTEPEFQGWYAMATWSLTGEVRRYDAASASFRGLAPVHPLGSPGGAGAWEIKARYSNIDLDHQPLTADGVTGGVQNVWSTGLNWYPTEGLRFMLDYDNIHVHHVGAPATDISADAIGLRSQISF
jgi:phosphate-selective porin OprO/OprP